LIAGYLGKDFTRLESPSVRRGECRPAAAATDREAYQLTAGLDIVDGEIAYRGFGPHVTGIQGSLTLTDGELRGTGVQAVFLDGPVTANVDAAGVPGYRVRIDVDGEVTIDAVRPQRSTCRFPSCWRDKPAGRERC